jgi:hypothetical protein
MPAKERTVQKPVRMPESWGPRLRTLSVKLAETGIPVSEAAVIRLALSRGLDALEAEHGIAASDGTKSPDMPEKGEHRPARKPKS